MIEGLADGRIGFYSKVHHAAVDGQAAVAMANSVFDMTPEPRRVKPPRVTRTNRYQLGVAELLGAGLSHQISQVVEFAKLLPPIAKMAYVTAKSSLTQSIENRRGKSVKLAAGKEIEAVTKEVLLSY